MLTTNGNKVWASYITIRETKNSSIGITNFGDLIFTGNEMTISVSRTWIKANSVFDKFRTGFVGATAFPVATLAYAIIDLGFGVATGTTLTDRIENATKD